MPSLLQKFFKKTTTKPFHHSPAYTKFREGAKLVLPCSLPVSSSEERVKDVQELEVCNQMQIALNPNSTFNGDTILGKWFKVSGSNNMTPPTGLLKGFSE